MAFLRRSLGLALAAPALIVPSAATAVHAYTPPAPPTKTLPKALDVYVPYQGQTVIRCRDRASSPSPSS
jgi:hypothetical protein